ncbi:hypothetical protein [Natrinema sp. 74]|uniref:hypothetical protein n=1 Tax=Natrinema sp. 74 TaxID=3384159 RepID=UPI0038D4F8CC
MSDSQLRERVSDVLNEADTSSESIVGGDDATAEDGEAALLETAAEANDIVESTEPTELLAAVGLDVLEDGSEPESIPEAIARGEEERVEDLRRLLRLAKLADRAGDSEFEGAVDDLRATIGERADSTDDATERTADGDEADGDLAADAAERDGNASGTADDLGDRLRSAMNGSFVEFGEEVSRLKAQLEERRAGAADGETAADEEDATTAAGETDNEPRQSGSGDPDRDTASRGPSRHSTMAPPPSKRADMRGTARYSTMPTKRR